MTAETRISECMGANPPDQLPLLSDLGVLLAISDSYLVYQSPTYYIVDSYVIDRCLSSHIGLVYQSPTGVLLGISDSYLLYWSGVLPVRGDGPPQGGRNGAPDHSLWARLLSS